jgi:hypothetical protein
MKFQSGIWRKNSIFTHIGRSNSNMESFLHLWFPQDTYSGNFDCWCIPR